MVLEDDGGFGLKTVSVAELNAQPETATILSKANVLVILHGLNEPGWPDENSEVLKIEWLSTMEKISFMSSGRAIDKPLN